MDFNSIAKNLGNEALNNVDVQALLKGFISENGLSISPADIKGLLSNDAVKQALMNAAKSIAMAEISGMGGQDSAIQKYLAPVAEKLLAKSPDTDLSKQDLVSNLKDYIQSNI